MTNLPNFGNTPLLSTIGNNYSQLHNLLVEQNWEEADRQTLRVMARAAGQPEGHLSSDSIEMVPCEDLCIINNLWLRANGLRFGFSVQSRIWESIVKSYATDNDEPAHKQYENFRDRFAVEVGWATEEKGVPLYFGSNREPQGEKLNSQNCTFIPSGYYPQRVLIYRAWGCQLINWNVLFSRMEYCLRNVSQQT
ncbi:GUN4 domain-containing protein [Phormidium sp. CLA17]|uniref:GUN4 domain-containing protein n=1 Tax=Leptolyngbya sp. Cla-17 TaxID=2803751 RepID=UPI001490D794|nr:GUN4 domain-containing protein [Leptolyngbya sp. Cla-17]MBM0744513.1 GUN4 domain-containing protein [Leptolyngbya sp. Cla-17]